MSRQINLIVIHCAATPNGDSLFRGSPGTPSQRTPVQAIDAMHQARGFRRSPKVRQAWNPDLVAIGYHFLIYTNGAVVTGRAPAEIGAHVAGFNAKSLGICLIGTDRFTALQWDALRVLVAGLQKTYPEAGVVGHRDLSPDTDGDGKVEPHEWLKICPGFSVADWLAGGMAPLSDHLWEPA
ncbi:N-acetylmuramoyl-L-alanine amidase [Rhodocyclus tenuis]|uniref:N-acetyl-anhydromuramyl-L-alanine amidase AmpD n=1 Tax=Rhodocyclus tenuis TaxID=1066 RepID=A0A840G918_RHOTE|nr:N-acetylmuramoyl-L-alanine amidase [Rhodocyclus tenuis]MBB4248365.1 N-acetyl-anhydromuramyl-L-alanine amidase AmpD [Rhodocyclus tenuis]